MTTKKGKAGVRLGARMLGAANGVVPDPAVPHLLRLHVERDKVRPACDGRIGTFTSESIKVQRSVKEECHRCPLFFSCSAYILENPGEFGVWAGTTNADRRHLAKDRSH